MAAVGGSLLTATVTAKAQCIGVCRGEVVGILVGIGAGSAAIGVGVTYAVRHNHAIRGCAVAGANGLELESQGGGETYALVGLVDGIKPGERIRVSGKKQEKADGAVRQFLVEKPAKIDGACTAP